MRRRFLMDNKSDDYIVLDVLSNYISFGLSENPIKYSIDNGLSWLELGAGQTTPLLMHITRVFIKCDPIYISLANGIGTFKTEGTFNLSGNVMALLGNRKEIPEFAFCYLFEGSGVVNVSKDFLPATNLARNCYYCMFRNCTSLVTAPELPATILADSCYYYMFYGCTSLTTAPELPATTLARGCYENMFSGCSKLNYIKMLATDISANDCLTAWVDNVASTGTFVKNPEATWEKYGTDGIPNGWKVVMDGEESNLKSFQVNDFENVEEFYFEDGMTWGEWVDSEYNNGYYTVDEMDGSICKLDVELDIPIGWIGNSYGYVLSSDIILEETYYLMQ